MDEVLRGLMVLNGVCIKR